MGIFYDNINFAKRYLDITKSINVDTLKKPYLSYFFPNKNQILYSSESFEFLNFWDEIILVNIAEKSQYDTLIELSQKDSLNNKILCLAGSGKKFHGFKNRKWNSHQGNIHLSLNFKPNQNIQNFTIGFLILSAVSVIQTIDQIKPLKNKSEIKWVNDILIDNKKVAGVLAHCSTQANIIKDAIIGIGLNVEINPNSKPTKFVPNSACLNDFLDNNNKVNEKTVFQNLIKNLVKNYNLLINNDYNQLLEFYKKRSIVIGKNVSIWSDDIHKENELICKGKVLNIGNNLELEIKGYNKKIINGRLALEE